MIINHLAFALTYLAGGGLPTDSASERTIVQEKGREGPIATTFLEPTIAGLVNVLKGVDRPKMGEKEEKETWQGPEGKGTE